MTQVELNEKLETLKENAEAVKALANAETLEEVKGIFEENGIDLTMDEIKMLVKIMEKEDGAEEELDGDALEMVSGGAGMTKYDLLYQIGRGCINYGIMIGNAIFKNNAKYI